ncbi:MAG: TIGR00296 family protein [Candidatus Bathyarchaeia archaeon]
MSKYTSHEIDLQQDEGRFLVEVARRAIMKYLKERKIMGPPAETPPKLYMNSGVFVTLRHHATGELRGCIGFPEPTNSLIEATITSAVEAATADPRFPSVTLEELNNDLIIEVSVLTPPREIDASPEEIPERIVIGVDGLIVARGSRRGLLLPQVAVEWGWDQEEFLANCSMKAGLPPDGWLLKGTKIFKFQAAVFREKSPRGPVERTLEEQHGA